MYLHVASRFFEHGQQDVVPLVAFVASDVEHFGHGGRGVEIDVELIHRISVKAIEELQAERRSRCPRSAIPSGGR